MTFVKVWHAIKTNRLLVVVDVVDRERGLVGVAAWSVAVTWPTSETWSTCVT